MGIIVVFKQELCRKPAVNNKVIKKYIEKKQMLPWAET